MARDLRAHVVSTCANRLRISRCCVSRLNATVCKACSEPPSPDMVPRLVNARGITSPPSPPSPDSLLLLNDLLRWRKDELAKSGEDAVVLRSGQRQARRSGRKGALRVASLRGAGSSSLIVAALGGGRTTLALRRLRGSYDVCSQLSCDGSATDGSIPLANAAAAAAAANKSGALALPFGTFHVKLTISNLLKIWGGADNVRLAYTFWPAPQHHRVWLAKSEFVTGLPGPEKLRSPPDYATNQKISDVENETDSPQSMRKSAFGMGLAWADHEITHMVEHSLQANPPQPNTSNIGKRFAAVGARPHAAGRFIPFPGGRGPQWGADLSHCSRNSLLGRGRFLRSYYVGYTAVAPALHSQDVVAPYIGVRRTFATPRVSVTTLNIMTRHI